MSRRLANRFRRRAVTGVFVVVMLPVLFGFAALAIDLGSRAVVRSELQNAVDAAVLAGVLDLAGLSPDPVAAETSARDVLDRNIIYGRSFRTNTVTSVDFGGILIDGGTGQASFVVNGGWEAIRVTVNTRQPYFFASLFGMYDTNVLASASAGFLGRPPVALWRLADQVGTVVTDDTGNHPGQTHGNVLLGVGGVISGNAAMEMGGKKPWDPAGFVEVPHSDEFLLDHGTISFWFNASDLRQKDQGLFSKDSGGYDTGGHVDIRIHERKVRFRLQSQSLSYKIDSPQVLVENAWYHLAVSFGAGGMRMFLNGTEVSSNPYTGGLGTTSGGAGNFEPISIGVSQVSTGDQTTDGWKHPFHGRIDEVAIFNRGITETEAKWLHRSVQAGNLSIGAAVLDPALQL